jgi:hypothetical protein
MYFGSSAGFGHAQKKQMCGRDALSYCSGFTCRFLLWRLFPLTLVCCGRCFVQRFDLCMQRFDV